MVSITLVSDGEELILGNNEMSGTMYLGDNGSNWNLAITSPYLAEDESGSGQSWSADGNVLTFEKGSEPWSYM